MDQSTVTAYLTRIGAAPARPSRAALAELSARHQATVPFENLSIHLGEPISLAPDELVDKIVRRRRGGYCYELNGLFAELLTALGYPVTRLSARVYGKTGRLGPPYDHLALRVDLEQPLLVDVGFGRHAEYPLLLEERGEQTDPDGVFRLRPAEFGDLDVVRDGEPAYRVENRPRELTEFAAMSWYQQTSPDSAFTKKPTCSLPRPGGGRITLSDRTLIRTAPDGERTEEQLDESAALAAYRDVFGFELDRLPTPPQPKTD